MKKDMEPNRTQKISIEVKKLFPEIREPVSFGQLTSIVENGLEMGCSSEVIQKVGNWWLGFRDFGIENMKTTQIQRAIKRNTLQGIRENKPVQLVATRSPDFILHFSEHMKGEPQISERSIQVIERVSEVRKRSSKDLSTQATIFLADIVLANADDPDNQLRPAQAERLLHQNLVALKKACGEIDPEIKIFRLGDVLTDNGNNLREIVGLSGDGAKNISIPPESINQVVKVAEESVSFHSQLGWSKEDVFQRTEKLAKCMGIVGRTFNRQSPKPIMLFMESFVKRANFNNILNPKNDPLLIICFNDLSRSRII